MISTYQGSGVVIQCSLVCGPELQVKSLSPVAVHQDRIIQDTGAGVNPNRIIPVPLLNGVGHRSHRVCIHSLHLQNALTKGRTDRDTFRKRGSITLSNTITMVLKQKEEGKVKFSPICIQIQYTA